MSFSAGTNLNQYLLSTEMGLGVLHPAAFEEGALFLKIFLLRKGLRMLLRTMSLKIVLCLFFFFFVLWVSYFHLLFMANPDVLGNMLKPLFHFQVNQ